MCSPGKSQGYQLIADMARSLFPQYKHICLHANLRMVDFGIMPFFVHLRGQLLGSLDPVHFGT